MGNYHPPAKGGVVIIVELVSSNLFGMLPRKLCSLGFCHGKFQIVSMADFQGGEWGPP
jgi:hypothetical protein